MNCENILLKIIIGDTFNFYNSKDLGEFVLGSRECPVTVKAPGVESYHLKFTYFDRGWYVQDISNNGLSKLNKKSIRTRPLPLREGDRIEIFCENHNVSVTVEILKKITSRDSTKMDTLRLTNKNEYILGRGAGCDIPVDNPRLENQHCKFIYDGKNCYVEDLHTFAGTFVNNNKIRRIQLNNYDRISVPGAAFVFYDFSLLSSKSTEGIEIEAANVEALYKVKRDTKKALDNISFVAGAGEFVGILGGEGSGKTTLLRCLTGEQPCVGGKILYDGNNYYDNVNSYKGVTGRILIDTAYTKKSAADELAFRLRDLAKNKEQSGELNERIDAMLVRYEVDKKRRPELLSCIDRVKLSMITALLQNPKILFLDRPTAGLSTENDLTIMEMLRALSTAGKTVIFTTDQVENIDLCDKIAVLGCGKLCYFGSHLHVFEYFGEHKFSRIFRTLQNPERASFFAQKQAETAAAHSTDSIITQAME